VREFDEPGLANAGSVERMTTKSIGIIVGSLREGAFSRIVAEHIAARLAPSHTVRFIEIGDLPLYNPDLDTDTPPGPWARARADLAASDAVLFVTPEYNRSMPAAVKNAIDVGSRPYGANVWADKPGAVVSVTPGGTGAMGSNFATRQALIFVDVHLMNQPEAYVGKIADAVADGAITDEGTAGFLNSWADAFVAWIARF
jgi:chromate reductase